MKSKQEWAQEFLNHHVLNVRGKEFEDFIERVQLDALNSRPLSEDYNRALSAVAKMGTEGEA